MQELERVAGEGLSDDTDKNLNAVPVSKQLVYMFFKNIDREPSEETLRIMYDIMNHYAVQGTFNFKNSVGKKVGIIEQACFDNSVTTEDFYRRVMGVNLFPDKPNQQSNSTVKMEGLEKRITDFLVKNLPN
ncbi:MAG: hypothetical protein ABIM99_00395 [Candidatus Dojkabacteria bacterium]